MMGPRKPLILVLLVYVGVFRITSIILGSKYTRLLSTEFPRRPSCLLTSFHLLNFLSRPCSDTTEITYRTRSACSNRVLESTTTLSKFAFLEGTLLAHCPSCSETLNGRSWDQRTSLQTKNSCTEKQKWISLYCSLIPTWQLDDWNVHRCEESPPAGSSNNSWIFENGKLSVFIRGVRTR